MAATPHPTTAREVAAILHDSPLEDLERLIERYEEDPRKQVQQAVKSARHRFNSETNERERVLGMYRLQDEMSGGGIVLGLDEVGRGALAGPVTVAAVALPSEPIVWGINDSKQLTPARREALAADIAEVALAIGIAHIPPETIDAVGMGNALRLAMTNAIADSGVEPDCVLIDGNPLHIHSKEKNLVKGDARLACVSAASIVAKVTRDSLMIGYDIEYPEYHLAECKGYGSAAHIEAIKAHGLSPIHRLSFCGNFLEQQSLF